jgi:hypothetical protein
LNGFFGTNRATENGYENGIRTGRYELGSPNSGEGPVKEAVMSIKKSSVGTEESLEASQVRMAGLRDEIRTRDLSNTNQAF